MAAALERGLVDPHEIIDCGNGSMKVAGALIRDHKRFDRLSASEVLEESSNVGAMRIGLRLGRDEFFETIRRFGIGERTGVDLPGETRGLLREPSQWSGVSQASLSFGQEVSVTPLQMLVAIAAVGNGGVLQPPRLVLRELDPDGGVLVERPAAAPRTILAPSTVARLTRMMRGVVENGTAKAAKMEGYSVAGKTGTAEKIGPSGTYADDRHIASFAGFTPASRPAIAILVVLDEPRGYLFHGGDVAAPVFRRIALPVLRYLGVAPDALESEGEQTASGVSSWRDRVAWASAGNGGPKKTHGGSRGQRAQREPKEEEAPFEPAPLPVPESVVSGDSVLLPDLAGHTLRRAVAYLGRIGLSARVSAIAAAQRDAAFAVIGTQAPPAGTLVRRGAEVVLTPGIPAPRPEAPEDEYEEEETGAAVARASMN
jgi:membrane peptidoglycan carboxypeptidase